MRHDSAPSPTSPRRRSLDVEAVLRELEQLHKSLKVGDAFPSQRELLERLDASERIVRGALDEFQRQGKIIRRVGRGGSIVAQPPLDSGHRQSERDEETRSSSTIAVITQPDSSFFDHAIHVLHSSVVPRNLTLSCHVATPATDVPSLLRQWNEKPAGYIVFRSELYEVARELHANGQPVVWVGTPEQGNIPTVPNVRGNHEWGGYQATKHLLQLGHRRLAFWGSENLKATLRWRGHERALEELKRQDQHATAELISDKQFEAWRLNPAEGKDYFSRPDAPTGLLCWNDACALEMLTFLNFIGVRVPHDVSLVGYDNLPASAKVFPALTTVDNNIEQQLEAALDLLTRPASGTPVVITVPTLIRRDSSAPLASRK